MSVYLDLTREFNEAGLRAVLSSGQAVVLHRLSEEEVERVWEQAGAQDVPFVPARELAELKKTNREKDDAVIGELARLLPDPAEQLLVSRSARDLVSLAGAHPDLVKSLAPRRPVLEDVGAGEEALEVALDAERRALMHANERRLLRYAAAAEAWAAAWPGVAEDVAGLPLTRAHAIVAARAEGVLPFSVQEGAS